jgi:hypothetical protein
MIERIAYAGTLPDSFFRIPELVYAAEPVRAPEDPAAIRALFREEAARHDINLYTDHRSIRLAGLFPHDSPDSALFGFWETTPDFALNGTAFQALVDDTRQRGRSRLIGPIQFTTYQPYRLRLGQVPSWERFDREPVQPTYYPPLLESLGFQVQHTFESRLVRTETVPAVYAQKAALFDLLATFPFDCIPLDARTWQRHENEIRELIDAVFRINPAYRPVSTAQFRRLYNPAYAAGLCPHTSVLFRDRLSGRLAALSLCHPNYAPLGLRTRLPEFSRDFERLPVKTLLAKTVGVHPDFRQRNLMNLLGAYGMVHFRERYENVIFCLMRSENASLRFTDGLPYESAHYALFERSVGYSADSSSSVLK